MGEIVLALFAHPDDEVLGCGGTLAKHVAAGNTVHARFLSTGVGSREEQDGSRRLAEMRAAATELGFASVDHASLPDQQFDTVPVLRVNRLVTDWVDALRPTVIYTHSPHDLNRDHRITSDAALVATRPFRYGPCLVLGCEIPGSGRGFRPVAWETLTADPHERGTAAMKAYRSEWQDSPLPRSGWAYTATRMGAGSKVGAWYAEGFEVLSWVR
jgi:LmbE family N-acetylglucosaminyl deacetylase